MYVLAVEPVLQKLPQVESLCRLVVALHIQALICNWLLVLDPQEGLFAFVAEREITAVEEG